MGRRQHAKGQHREVNRRVAILERIGLPYPSEFAGTPAEDQLVSLYVEAAGRYSEALADAVTPISLRRAVHAAHLYLDELLSQIPTTVGFADGTATIACRRGCNYCCTIRVTTPAWMVLALAYYLRKRLDDSEMAALLERIETHVDVGRRLSPLGQVLNTRMCPLNVDGSCIGYEHRPSGCRYYHSFDVQRCKEDMEAPEEGAKVPQDPERRAIQTLVMMAASKCAELFGLDQRELEFIPALRIALREADAAERYLAGEDVFADAFRPEVREAQMKDMAERGLLHLPQVKD